MDKKKLPRELIKRLEAITNKRPKTVIKHILEHGHITTEELKTIYGYEHPPRAARDVREEGVPLETFYVKDSNGRRIAAYRLDDMSLVRNDRMGGRKVISKKFKDSLTESLGCKCSVCLAEYEDRYLQVDHRVPYEVSGEGDNEVRDNRDYMLICGSCNRAKSWSCEHCVNWQADKKADVCETCYWARPESYKHIALRLIRRLYIVWTESEVGLYERLKERTESIEESMPEFVKKIIARHLKIKG